MIFIKFENMDETHMPDFLKSKIFQGPKIFEDQIFWGPKKFKVQKSEKSYVWSSWKKIHGICNERRNEKY